MFMNNIAPFVSLMTTHINVNGKVCDALLCQEIAQYINKVVVIEKTCPTDGIFFLFDDLFAFIFEYGETVVESYCGRDEYGEKEYFTYNPDTNWHERVRVALVDLGFYAALNKRSKEAA